MMLKILYIKFILYYLLFISIKKNVLYLISTIFSFKSYLFSYFISLIIFQIYFIDFYFLESIDSFIFYHLPSFVSCFLILTLSLILNLFLFLHFFFVILFVIYSYMNLNLISFSYIFHYFPFYNVFLMLYFLCKSIKFFIKFFI